MDLTREQIVEMRRHFAQDGDCGDVVTLCDMALRARAEGEAVAWMYEHDGSIAKPLVYMTRWPDCREPWTETPLYAHPAPSGMRLVPEEASGMFTPEQEKFLALVMDKTRARGHRLSNVEILRELAAAPEAK